MLIDSLETPEGRLVQTLRAGKALSEVAVRDVRSVLQELVATRIHLALVSSETMGDLESARALARSFLSQRFPEGF